MGSLTVSLDNVLSKSPYYVDLNGVTKFDPTVAAVQSVAAQVVQVTNQINYTFTEVQNSFLTVVNNVMEQTLYEVTNQVVNQTFVTQSSDESGPIGSLTSNLQAAFNAISDLGASLTAYGQFDEKNLLQTTASITGAIGNLSTQTSDRFGTLSAAVAGTLSDHTGSLTAHHGSLSSLLIDMGTLASYTNGQVASLSSYIGSASGSLTELTLGVSASLTSSVTALQEACAATYLAHTGSLSTLTADLGTLGSVTTSNFLVCGSNLEATHGSLTADILTLGSQLGTALASSVTELQVQITAGSNATQALSLAVASTVSELYGTLGTHETLIGSNTAAIGSLEIALATTVSGLQAVDAINAGNIAALSSATAGSVSGLYGSISDLTINVYGSIGSNTEAIGSTSAALDSLANATAGLFSSLSLAVATTVSGLNSLIMGNAQAINTLAAAEASSMTALQQASAATFLQITGSCSSLTARCDENQTAILLLGSEIAGTFSQISSTLTAHDGSLSSLTIGVQGTFTLNASSLTAIAGSASANRDAIQTLGTACAATFLTVTGSLTAHAGSLTSNLTRVLNLGSDTAATLSSVTGSLSALSGSVSGNLLQIQTLGSATAATLSSMTGSLSSHGGSLSALRSATAATFLSNAGSLSGISSTLTAQVAKELADVAFIQTYLAVHMTKAGTNSYQLAQNNTFYALPASFFAPSDTSSIYPTGLSFDTLMANNGVITPPYNGIYQLSYTVSFSTQNSNVAIFSSGTPLGNSYVAYASNAAAGVVSTSWCGLLSTTDKLQFIVSGNPALARPGINAAVMNLVLINRV